MVYFFDTSALVKRYHREPGTEVVDDAFDDLGTDCVISDLGIVEFYSAFAQHIFEVVRQRLQNSGETQ